ncbi:uncharacterized protein PAC_19623 [Phialocephala subalpina]|uniref:Lipocalin-like domain-containing protein n=1 Tax=Phialocephala subalpina TaxID=576137 RepID=A0A1L7XXE4_9HELO|nr:uncharacterized protein PAC_19623 [Phialocephala subalpina]
MPFELQQLVGIWKLLFIDNTYPESHRTNLTGRIMFTADGYMNALIREPSIEPFNFNWAFASDSQVAAIARGVTAYCGMYTVHNESGQVYTQTKLDVSLSPSWMLQDQIRYATFEEKDGKTLMTLIPAVNGAKADNRLTWEKIPLQPLTML